MTLINNEKVKLTANWLNAMASGVVITGSVAPAIGFFVGVAPTPLLLIAVFSLAWLLVGVAIHMIAKWYLGRLEP